jgi:phage terminase Nu1 subunit (DNA packaging protein)
MGDQVTARALANLLGVSEKALSELAKRGIVAPTSHRRYALEASVNSYCAYLRAIVAGHAGEDATLAKTKLKSQQ